MKRSGNIFFGCSVTVIGIFLFVLALILKVGSNFSAFITVVCIASFAILLGVIEIVIYLIDVKVRRLGREAAGRVVFIKKPLDKNTLATNGQTYAVVYSYLSESGKKKRFKTYLQKHLAEKLNEGDNIPVILYKERAVIDYKKLS